MLVLTGETRHLRYLSLGYLVSVDPADTHALLVHMEHDTGRLLRRLVEEAFEDVHDEIHRRVVVVEQQHLVAARPFGFRPRLGNDMSAGVVAPASVAVPRHRQPLCCLLYTSDAADEEDSVD